MKNLNQPVEDIYKFKLSFKGQLVENSVDAFDVANTILATSQAFQEVANIIYDGDMKDSIKININAFQKGSLITDFLVYIDNNKTALVPLIAAAPEACKIGKEVLSAVKTFIDIRIALKGKPPKEVAIRSDGLISIVGDNNKVTFNVTPQEFRTLQDKAVSKNIAKSIEPLIKDNSLLDNIEIYDEEEQPVSIGITKEQASFLRGTEDFQTLPSVKYKGTISKVDTKARSGYIDIQSKRLPFTYPKNLAREKFEILIDSLKTRVQIYLIGEVVMDYEANPRNMSVLDVESDSTLFN